MWKRGVARARQMARFAKLFLTELLKRDESRAGISTTEKQWHSFRTLDEHNF